MKIKLKQANSLKHWKSSEQVAIGLRFGFD